MKPVLLAGEIFHTSSFSNRGFEVVASSRRFNGAERFIAALNAAGIEVAQIDGPRCEAEFPTRIDQLDRYAAVVLSDIGALSLLMTPEARDGYRSINRLQLLRQWTAEGGGVMMAGGYSSFQGLNGAGMYHGTALEEFMPVSCQPGPDLMEAPEGLDPRMDEIGHPIFANISGPLPYILGMNRVDEQPGNCSTLAHCERGTERYPLLSVRDYQKGRSLAWTTDIGPHWLSQDFVRWEGHDLLMANMVRWVAREI